MSLASPFPNPPWPAPPRFEARVHGGPDERELHALGLAVEALLDFSSSTNPYGPHPQMMAALRGAALGRYPDSSAARARQALAAQLGRDASELVLGNGAAELLWTLSRTLLGPGVRAVIAEPTFSEFRAAAHCAGAQISEWRSRVDDGFAIELGALAQRARESRARLVYVCSPNTPVGTTLAAGALASCAAEHPEMWWVLDQSFLSLSERFDDVRVGMPPNVVCVRSLTKDHGIPGVRVGYLVGSAELCRSVEANRPQWSTSAFAQAAAIASCECAEFVAESRRRLLVDRDALRGELGQLGVETLPSTATFFVARVSDAAALRRRLLARHGILVRDCSSFGMPGFVRLAAKPEPARRRLIAAWREENAP